MESLPDNRVTVVVSVPSGLLGIIASVSEYVDEQVPDVMLRMILDGIALELGNDGRMFRRARVSPSSEDVSAALYGWLQDRFDSDML